ncbi:MAG: prolipoprotein diacylglyceryl transferase, partial [bacterium]|nr:prolipoprotein diacylglyceryl transferase [bacterium]
KAYYHLDEAGKIISDLPLAMRFPPGSSAYGSMLHSATAHGRELILSNATTLPLFPSQLAEGFGTMCIFFILYWLSPRKWFHGQLLLSYLVLYSVMRSFLEMYRGDDAERGYVIAGLLSTSQFISLVVVIIAAIAMVIIKKKRDRALNI